MEIPVTAALDGEPDLDERQNRSGTVLTGKLMGLLISDS